VEKLFFLHVFPFLFYVVFSFCVLFGTGVFRCIGVCFPPKIARRGDVSIYIYIYSLSNSQPFFPILNHSFFGWCVSGEIDMYTRFFVGLFCVGLFRWLPFLIFHSGKVVFPSCFSFFFLRRFLFLCFVRHWCFPVHRGLFSPKNCETGRRE